MTQTTIYTLADPRTGAVRYVGKTSRTVVRRMHGHMAAVRQGGRLHVTLWIASLVAAGVLPTIEVVEIVPHGSDWEAAERGWIARLRASGADLCNITEGGGGGTGHRWPKTPEWRAKVSAANTGKKKTPEAIDAWRTSRAGYRTSDELKAKLSAALKGKTKSASHVQAQAASRRGKGNTPEMRAAMSALMQTPDMQAKLKAAHKPGREYRTDHLVAFAEARRGVPMPEAQRAAIAAGNKGRTIPPEIREKMRLAAIRREEQKRQAAAAARV